MFSNISQQAARAERTFLPRRLPRPSSSEPLSSSSANRRDCFQLAIALTALARTRRVGSAACPLVAASPPAVTPDGSGAGGDRSAAFLARLEPLPLRECSRVEAVDLAGVTAVLGTKWAKPVAEGSCKRDWQNSDQCRLVVRACVRQAKRSGRLDKWVTVENDSMP